MGIEGIACSGREGGEPLADNLIFNQLLGSGIIWIIGVGFFLGKMVYI